LCKNSRDSTAAARLLLLLFMTLHIDAVSPAAGRWWELNDNPDYYIAVAEGEAH
jgi:hypothetical protein